MGLVAALAAILLLTGTAALANPAYPVRLGISHREPFFHGSAASAGGATCTKHRRVKLWQYRRRRGKHPKLVGTARTGAHGRWTILDPSPRKGYWYRVRVAQKVSAGAVCQAASSPAVQVL